MENTFTVSRVGRQGSELPNGLARAHGQLELLAVCDAVDLGWALEMADLLREARREAPPRVNFDPHDLAWIFQSIWQSAGLLSRTRHSPGLVRRNIDEMHVYLDGLWSSVPFSPHQLHTSP
ncbi:hypothetical protein TSACC_293 [Terrimicrobium sacchariphilum]|uniref:Uncharacterized protein n=1 Tax=Terrimicrobium sacchariphilum TaxID=690879 RepID=A0A146G1G7_TERSA|nr:hypothetical protein [Terrimicrobium sacchariphilum]GAT31699.1 hypothetical protein TSACC_293 [Terrimicrobium sacchariphilum]